jgi:hypothetical protein
MSDRNYRQEFVDRCQALGRGDSARMDADEERAFQQRLDACTSEREKFILKNQFLNEHGRFPGGHSDHSEQTSRQNAGVSSGGRTDQQAGGKDPRADYLERLKAAGMNNGETFHRESRQDAAAGAKRVQRFDGGKNAGYLLFD